MLVVWHVASWVWCFVGCRCMCSPRTLVLWLLWARPMTFPIHAFPLPDAIPRPVSLSQPASFQPISLPVQPLPKRGAFQRSPPGIPGVQADSGTHLFPWALPRPGPRFRLRLGTALAAQLGPLFRLPRSPLPSIFPPLTVHLPESFSCLLLCHPWAVDLRLPRSMLLTSQLKRLKGCRLKDCSDTLLLFVFHRYWDRYQKAVLMNRRQHCGTGHSHTSLERSHGRKLMVQSLYRLRCYPLMSYFSGTCSIVLCIMKPRRDYLFFWEACATVFWRFLFFFFFFKPWQSGTQGPFDKWNAHPGLRQFYRWRRLAF